MKRLPIWRLGAAALAALMLLSGCQAAEPESSDPSQKGTTVVASQTAAETTEATNTQGTKDKTQATGNTVTKVTKAPTKAQTPVTKKPTSKPTTKPADKPKTYTLKQSDFIKNKTLWETPSLSDNGFQFEAQIINNGGTFVTNLLRMSIQKKKVGDTATLLPSPRAWEWGYAAVTFDKGATTGWGSYVSENVFRENPPTSRRDALVKLKQFVQTVFKVKTGEPWTSNNGHYPWHHYAGEFGATVIASEIGENIHNYQYQIAMNRGAARQYQTPWAVSFSFWHGPVATNYDGKNNDSGHSVSLYARTMVMSYMAGVDVYAPEGAGDCSFYNQLGDDGLYKISPHGEAARDFVAFTENNKDVGVNYTPIGVVLDYYHGSYMGLNTAKKAFANFDYTAGDTMTWDLTEMLWPGAWNGATSGNETGVMTNKGYGDYFDMLLQNAPQNLLNTYPALVLTGDIELTAAEKARYKAYVEQGGTLVLNTAYLGQFPEYKGTLNASGRFDKTVGKGKVIVYGDDYKVDKLAPILKELVNKYIPFTVSTPVQQMVNVKDGSLFVTLINNEGVTKTSSAKPIVDASKAKTVTVTYTGPLTPKAVKDVYNGKTLTLSGKKTTVKVGPGESAILEFVFD